MMIWLYLLLIISDEGCSVALFFLNAVQKGLYWHKRFKNNIAKTKYSLTNYLDSTPEKQYEQSSCQLLQRSNRDHPAWKHHWQGFWMAQDRKALQQVTRTAWNITGSHPLSISDISEVKCPRRAQRILATASTTALPPDYTKNLFPSSVHPPHATLE